MSCSSGLRRETSPLTVFFNSSYFQFIFSKNPASTTWWFPAEALLPGSLGAEAPSKDYHWTRTESALNPHWIRIGSALDPHWIRTGHSSRSSLNVGGECRPGLLLFVIWLHFHWSPLRSWFCPISFSFWMKSAPVLKCFILFLSNTSVSQPLLSMSAPLLLTN